MGLYGNYKKTKVVFLVIINYKYLYFNNSQLIRKYNIFIIYNLTFIMIYICLNSILYLDFLAITRKRELQLNSANLTVWHI